MLITEFLRSLLQTQNGRIVVVALFMFFSSSTLFFSKLLDVYAQQPGGLVFSASVIGLSAIITVLFFLLVCHGRLTRWILAFFVIVSAPAAHFMSQYGIVIDAQMIDNMMQTDRLEFWGLVTPSLIFRTLFLGVLPAWLIIRHDLRVSGFFQEAKNRLLAIAACVLLAGVFIVPFTSSYATFIRAHKEVRMYISPLSFTYAALHYSKNHLLPKHALTHLALAMDVHEIGNRRIPKLIVLVIGETARSDRFSLNGYGRDTNPGLRNQGVISFTQATSCGTSTAVSVPCMFSVLGREKYDPEEARREDNALDVLTRSGVRVLWRDNNSDSKGVADHIEYENFKSAERNPICDPECRDIGMLDGLEDVIRKNKGRDLLIVMHQMGSHGPEYYKRYPVAFETFKPVCRSGELQTCSKAEIDNAYDNTIRYTDYFLSGVIDFLKKYDGPADTAMLYVSDHGESLGEKGMYLHGAPYQFAPDQQTHVPVIFWLGKHADFSTDQIRRDLPVSHDDLFCTLLIAFDRETELCKKYRPAWSAYQHLSSHS